MTQQGKNEATEQEKASYSLAIQPQKELQIKQQSADLQEFALDLQTNFTSTCGKNSPSHLLFEVPKLHEK